MKTLLLATLVSAFTAAVVFGTDANQTLFCTAAKKEVKTCCCEMKDGKSFCKLTGKTFDKCCCVSKNGKKGRS